MNCVPTRITFLKFFNSNRLSSARNRLWPRHTDGSFAFVDSTRFSTSTNGKNFLLINEKFFSSTICSWSVKRDSLRSESKLQRVSFFLPGDKTLRQKESTVPSGDSSVDRRLLSLRNNSFVTKEKNETRRTALFRFRFSARRSSRSQIRLERNCFDNAQRSQRTWPEKILRRPSGNDSRSDRIRKSSPRKPNGESAEFDDDRPSKERCSFVVDRLADGQTRSAVVENFVKFSARPKRGRQ